MNKFNLSVNTGAIGGGGVFGNPIAGVPGAPKADNLRKRSENVAPEQTILNNNNLFNNNNNRTGNAGNPFAVGNITATQQQQPQQQQPQLLQAQSKTSFGGFGQTSGGGFGLSANTLQQAYVPKQSFDPSSQDFSKFKEVFNDYLRKFQFHVYEKRTNSHMMGYEEEDDENPNPDELTKKVLQIYGNENNTDLKALEAQFNQVVDGLIEKKKILRKELLDNNENLGNFKKYLKKFEDTYEGLNNKLEGYKKNQVRIKSKCIKLMKQLVVVSQGATALDSSEKDFKHRLDIIRQHIKDPQFKIEDLKSSFRADSRKKTSRGSKGKGDKDYENQLKELLQLCDFQSDLINDQVKVLLRNQDDIVVMRDALKLK